METIYPRLYLGFENNKPKYKEVELDKWNYGLPCHSSTPDIRDTYHAMIWRQWRMHRGVDYIGNLGRPILAIGGGTVTRVRRDEWLGIYVDIFHGDNRGYWQYSRSCHLDSATVWTGMKVRKGDVIGRMGSTGDSDCYHLHQEILIRGINELTKKRVPYDAMKQIDPIPNFNREDILRRYNYAAQNARVPGDDTGL